MLLHKVGAVVIVNTHTSEVEDGREAYTSIPVAMGIVTKSDLLQAYRDRVDIDSPCHQIMGDRKLVSCLPSDDRDAVARILETHQTHHVIVVDANHSRFMGIMSSLDVARRSLSSRSGAPSWGS